MRILLFRNAFTPASPPRVATFITQVVRQAAEQGHDVRELVPHTTDADKGPDHLQVQMRRRLDAEVLRFDPEVIHVQGVGILGHLALESGVPYLVSVFGEELLSGQSGVALRTQAEQALENAGLVVVDGDETWQHLHRVFGTLERILVVPRMDTSSDACKTDWLWPLYEQVLAARRGGRP